MNTYTFTYYGWIPGYNDFDQDWFDVIASSPIEAMEIAKMQIQFVKAGPALVAINGINIKDIESVLGYLN